MNVKKSLHVLCILIFFALSCKGDGSLLREGDKLTEQEANGEEEPIVIPENSPFGINGRLKLIGTQLSNQYDTPVQLRGMSTHGLQYRGNCYNVTSLGVLFNSWKADILRISMYIQEGGYETDPEYFTHFVDSLVDICYENGIYALIDWHMLNPSDPNHNTDLAKVFFEHVSEKHAAKGNVIYEICNEPNDNYSPTPVTWPVIKNYADQIVPIIRNNDPESIIIVGTPEFAARPDLVIGNPIAANNVMYTMHFYAADSWSERHQEKRMGYVSEAIENGIPVFVTEFGTQDGYGDGANDFVMSARWLRFLAERKISWCNWNYSDSPLSGGAWKEGTCPNGPWEDFNLKEAGLWIKNRFTNPVADWSGDFPSFAYDLGTGSGTLNPTSSIQVSESTNGSPGFLPEPSTGVARIQLAANAAQEVAFGSSAVDLGTSGVSVPNKFSLYDITEYTSLARISFKLNFNDTHRAYFAIGIGSAEIADVGNNIFKGNVGYMDGTVAPARPGLFAALRIPIGGATASTIQYRNPNPNSANASHANGPVVPRNGSIEFELYCNNTSISKTYERNGTSYTLPGRSLHMFIDGVQAAVNGDVVLPTCAETPEYEPINALVFSNEVDPWTAGTHAMKASISDVEIKSLFGN